MGLGWFLAFISATGVERLVELRVGKRNLEWSLAQGGVEHGRGHWPFMVALHTGFLFGCVAEALWAPMAVSLGFSLLMVVAAVACQGLRWWCIQTLGPRWNPRVIVVPGGERVTGGPYRLLPHPNYLAVAIEGVVLPMMFGCWRTASAFTVLNIGLMVVRIRCENEAIAQLRPR
jgi:methyltransferase